jgi:hypothetical protein
VHDILTAARHAATPSARQRCATTTIDSDSGAKEEVLVQLLNYVEDVVAQTVGFDDVGYVLERCVLPLAAEDVDWLVVAAQ